MKHMALIWSEGFCLGPLQFTVPAGKKKTSKKVQKHLRFQCVSFKFTLHVQCCEVCPDRLQSSQSQRSPAHHFVMVQGSR